MNLLFFWLKIAIRRIIYLIKRSPVIFIGTIIIVSAFFIARNDIDLILGTQTLVVTVVFLVFGSLSLSLKNYHTMPLLMMYSKSGFPNRTIRNIFFIKRAFINNILLVVFNIILLKGLVKTNYFAIAPMAAIFSIVSSFLLMYAKNERVGKKIRKITMVKQKTSPVIKSAIYDYLSSEFLQTTVISIGLFMAVAVLLIGNIRFLHELENPSIVYVGILIILSLGFMGIIESIPHINWRFHAIVFPQKFIWHIKRTALFLGVLFILPVAFLVFMAFFFGFALSLKYLYCTAMVLLLSIHIAFMIGGRLTKALLLLSAVAFTVWISTLNTAFLLILAVPVLLTFFKANNEYRERYYL